MKIFSPVLKGTTTVSGGTTALSGSFTGSLQGTSSYATNADLLDGVHLSVLATTGSNQFNGNQTVTGSLTTTGTITAQTLVVQTVTSSVDFVTGSARFGSTTGNTHQFTGSVSINPSLTVNNFFQSGSFPLNVNAYTEPYVIGTNSYKSLYVQSGTAVQLSSQISASAGTTAFLFDVNAYSGSAATNVYFGAVAGTTGNGPANFVIGRRTAVSTWSESLRIDTSGNVGIGTSSPSYTLDVNGTIHSSKSYADTSNMQLIAEGNIAGINIRSTQGGRFSILESYIAPNITSFYTSTGTSDPSIEAIRITNSTGVATFASNIIVGNVLDINGNNTIASVNDKFAMGVNSTSYAWIQSFGGRALILQGSGNNVGIGTTSPSHKLTVQADSADMIIWRSPTYITGILGLDTNNSHGAMWLLSSGTTKIQISALSSSPTYFNAGNVGIGTVSPNVKLEVLDTSTSSGEVARFQRNIDQINEYAYIRVGNNSYPAYFGSMLGTYDIAYMSMSPNPTDGKAICIRTTDGNVGIGVVNPLKKLEVNGRMSTTAVVSGNIIVGNIASNIATSPSFILIVDLNDAAGFSLSGKVNAASYTCWNISDIWIKKDYSATTSAAGITGAYKSGCDFSIVDCNYGGGRYIALRFTSNPEIDVMFTGYRLNSMFNADGSAQVVTGATVNSTLATY